jgi:hypothetical protein
MGYIYRETVHPKLKFASTVDNLNADETIENGNAL